RPSGGCPPALGQPHLGSQWTPKTRLPTAPTGPTTTESFFGSGSERRIADDKGWCSVPQGSRGLIASSHRRPWPPREDQAAFQTRDVPSLDCQRSNRFVPLSNVCKNIGVIALPEV